LFFVFQISSAKRKIGGLGLAFPHARDVSRKHHVCSVDVNAVIALCVSIWHAQLKWFLNNAASPESHLLEYEDRPLGDHFRRRHTRLGAHRSGVRFKAYHGRDGTRQHDRPVTVVRLRFSNGRWGTEKLT